MNWQTFPLESFMVVSTVLLMITLSSLQELWLALLEHVMGRALAQSAKLILGITVIGNV